MIAATAAAIYYYNYKSGPSIPPSPPTSPTLPISNSNSSVPSSPSLRLLPPSRSITPYKDPALDDWVSIENADK